MGWPQSPQLSVALANAELVAVYRILCKRVFSLKRRHAIVELNREAVQCSFPVMNGHGPFAADVV